MLVQELELLGELLFHFSHQIAHDLFEVALRLAQIRSLLIHFLIARPRLLVFLQGPDVDRPQRAHLLAQRVDAATRGALVVIRIAEGPCVFERQLVALPDAVL